MVINSKYSLFQEYHMFILLCSSAKRALLNKSSFHQGDSSGTFTVERNGVTYHYSAYFHAKYAFCMKVLIFRKQTEIFMQNVHFAYIFAYIELCLYESHDIGVNALLCILSIFCRRDPVFGRESTIRTDK